MENYLQMFPNSPEFLGIHFPFTILSDKQNDTSMKLAICYFRYNEAVKQCNFDAEHLKAAHQLIDWFHRFVLCLEASKTWFDFSAAGSVHYKECEGNKLLNWRDKGFKSIIDILLVSVEVCENVKTMQFCFNRPHRNFLQKKFYSTKQ